MPRLAFRCSALFACVFATQALTVAQEPPRPLGSRPAEAPAALPAIGVVDFVQVFDAYPKFVQDRKQFEEQSKMRQAELAEEQSKLNQLKIQRDTFTAGTREYALRQLELDCALRRYDGLRQIMEAQLRQEFDKLKVQGYEEVEPAVRKAAKERGLLLVLRVHRDLGDGSPQDKAMVFERRNVWYAAEEIDLTAAVIKLLQQGPLTAPQKPDAGKDAKK